MFAFHTLPFGLPHDKAGGIYKTNDKRTFEAIKWVRRSINVAVFFLFAVGHVTAALWCLLASAILWAGLFARINQSYTKIIPNQATENMIWDAWAASHIGLINWALDIPGMGCSTTKKSHVLIILANIAGAAAITLGVFIAPQIERAWGCYGNFDSLSDLTSGPCASYFNLCPDNVVRCPDFSVPACMLPSTNVNCGADIIGGAIASEFEPFGTAGIGILSVSFSTYVLTFNHKYETYVESLQKNKV